MAMAQHPRDAATLSSPLTVSATVPTVMADHSDGAVGARAYFPNLDGLRAVAVVWVVAWHVGSSSFLHSLKGGRGVEWFFALSGFLITTLALREEQRRGSMALRPFFIRRAFRILPLYVIALTSFVVADVIVFRNKALTAAWKDHWPFYVTFMQDLPFKLHWPNSPFAVAWSLGVEEKFYLLWPLLGFGLLRRHTRLPATAAMAAGLAVTMVMFKGQAVAALSAPYLTILFGCILAIVIDDIRSTRLWKAISSGQGLIALALIVLIPWPQSIEQSGAYAVSYPAIVAILVGVLADGRPLPALSSQPMLWIGRRSYAIYLFHDLAIRLVDKVIYRTPLRKELAGGITFTVALIVSLVVADVLHRTVEMPSIRRGRTIAAAPVSVATV